MRDAHPYTQFLVRFKGMVYALEVVMKAKNVVTVVCYWGCLVVNAAHCNVVGATRVPSADIHETRLEITGDTRKWQTQYFTYAAKRTNILYLLITAQTLRTFMRGH